MQAKPPEQSAAAHPAVQGDSWFYRMDFRPPAIILSEGFQGSTSPVWMNLLYGRHTVFCSRSLRGISRFACEALLQRNADGTPYEQEGGMFAGMAPYAPADAWVYRFCAEGLEYLDTLHDLGFRNTLPTPFAVIDPHSQLLRHVLSGQTAAMQTQHLRQAKDRLAEYASDCAMHTEEILVKGPVAPQRIQLYQHLPLHKPWRPATPSHPWKHQ